MATLRQAAQSILNDARDGIQWIALWKEGRSWCAATYSIDYDERENNAVLDYPEDLDELQKILAKDPHAIIVNSYYNNLAVCENYVTRDNLAAALRWQYDLQHAPLADFLERIVQPEQITEAHEDEITDNSLCKVNNVSEEAKDWRKKERSVTMTKKQWSRLVIYLLLSTNYRNGELQAWQDRSKEKLPDGTPKFKNAASHAEFWQEMIDDLDTIVLKLDGM